MHTDDRSLSPTRWIEDNLQDLEDRRLRRSLVTLEANEGRYIVREGRRLLHLASNNYLDLAHHPRIGEAVRNALDRWGWGAGASQLLAGHTALHAELRQELARFEKAEECVLFPTGYLANLGTVSALVGKGDRILLDKLCHASIIDGAHLSGAEVRVYPHGNLPKLERLLAQPSSGKTLIVTDSVFSMDGDLAPLPEIAALAQRYQAMLLVDEAHATGVLGSRGSGAVEWMFEDHPSFPFEEAQSLRAAITVRIGTLSKALGGIGGFAVGSKSICDYLLTTARAAIFTTSLPPAAVAAARAALDLLREEPWRREAVLANAKRFREGMRAQGIPVLPGITPIVPILIGEVEPTLRLSQALLEAGIYAPPIRPPTVPPGTCRLRISWIATHTPEEVDFVVETVAQIWKKVMGSR